LINKLKELIPKLNLKKIFFLKKNNIYFKGGKREKTIKKVKIRGHI
jgi:hypothetical protein